MNDFRFFISKNDLPGAINSLLQRKKQQEPVKIAILSDFFSNISEDLFCTNAMYSNFKDEILSSVSIYSPKQSQFVGYWAFIYNGQKKGMDQLKQIADMEYIFKKWE